MEDEILSQSILPSAICMLPGISFPNRSRYSAAIHPEREGLHL